MVPRPAQMGEDASAWYCFTTEIAGFLLGLIVCPYVRGHQKRCSAGPKHLVVKRS